jgi:putative ABC transport system permease protein
MDACAAAGSTLVFVSHDERLATRFDASAVAAAAEPGHPWPRMKALLPSPARSALNRRGTLALVVLSIALATALLLSLERLRTDIRSSFSQAVSGTDLVVGARTGPVQLMLYAVFRVGGATNNIRMDSVRAIAEHRAVAWVVPFPWATATAATRCWAPRPSTSRALPTASGSPWCWRRAVPSAARWTVCTKPCWVPRWRRRWATSWTSASRWPRAGQGHAIGAALAVEHADKPFTVVGVLARTGTPVDRTVHVSLQAIEAIHLDWVGGGARCRHRRG